MGTCATLRASDPHCVYACSDGHLGALGSHRSHCDDLGRLARSGGERCEFGPQQPWRSPQVSVACLNQDVTAASRTTDPELQRRLDRLEAEIVAAEDVRAIKKLQRAYGYYVDKGMWADLSSFFTEDAIANYPAGVFIGAPSIRRASFHECGWREDGRGRARRRPPVRPPADPAGDSSRSGREDGAGPLARPRDVRQLRRRRRLGRGRLRDGLRQGKRRLEDSHARLLLGLRCAVSDGLGRTTDGGKRSSERGHEHVPARGPSQACASAGSRAQRGVRWLSEGLYRAVSLQQSRDDRVGQIWTISGRANAAAGDPALTGNLRARIAERRASAVQLCKTSSRSRTCSAIYGYYLDRAMWDQVADLFAADGTIEIGLRGVYVGKLAYASSWICSAITASPRADERPSAAAGDRRCGARWPDGARAQPGAWHDGRVRRSGHVERGRLREHLREASRGLEVQVGALLSDVHHRLRQGMGEGRSARADSEHRLPPDRPPSESTRSIRKPTCRRIIIAIRSPASRLTIPPWVVRIPRWRRPRCNRRNGPSATAGRCGCGLGRAERTLERVKDYDELENLESAYGYYLDKLCGTTWPICSPRTARWSSRNAASTTARTTCAPFC